jgi:ATP synthase protein I
VKNKQGLIGVYRLLCCQFGITLLIAMLMWFFRGTQEACSALLGGGVSIIPTFFFARTLFKYQGARDAKCIVNNFYKGEFFKIFISVILFAVVFKLLTVNPLVFFASYILAHTMFWFAPLIFVNKQNRLESD